VATGIGGDRVGDGEHGGVGANVSPGATDQVLPLAIQRRARGDDGEGGGLTLVYRLVGGLAGDLWRLVRNSVDGAVAAGKVIEIAHRIDLEIAQAAGTAGGAGDRVAVGSGRGGGVGWSEGGTQAARQV